MRFVVLHHTGWPGHQDHYDLMLQFTSGLDDDSLVLRTFSSLTDIFPLYSTKSSKSMAVKAAEKPYLLRLIDDHRLSYLHFEGPLSQNRGSVKRVDEGELLFLDPFTPNACDIRFHLTGVHLTGNFRLVNQRDSIYSFETI